jgi:hypothetical protein
MMILAGNALSENATSTTELGMKEKWGWGKRIEEWDG